MGKEGVEGKVDLPPGFRFFPTDEELVVHYLSNKVVSRPLPAFIIGEVDLYKYDPWQLPEKALFGEKEWYFFTPRDRKYPNGSRPNRAAGSGYWKATGADKPITSCGGKKRVGVKKALVFYKGKAPKGSKTNWIMHEYRLAEINMAARKKNSLRLDDWVLCRIYNKKTSAEKIAERKIMEETPSKEEEMNLPPTMKNEGINNLQTVQSSDPSSHDANSTICAAVASSSSPNCMLSSLDVNPFYRQTPIVTANYNRNTIPVPLHHMARTTTGNYSSFPYCNVPNLILPEKDEVQSNFKTDNFAQKQPPPTQIQGGGVTSQSLFNFGYGGGGLQSHNNNFLPSEQIEAASFKNPYQDYIDTLYNLKCYQASDMVLH